MPGIFVSSKKRELKPYVLLGTSSGVTTLSEMINSSRVTTMNTSFTSSPAIFFCLDEGYSDILASVSVLVNASNMSTRSGGFPGFPRPSSSDGKGAKGTDRIACIGAAGIGSTCTKDTCARGTGAGDTSSAGGAYVKGAFVGGACAESTCASGASAVEHSGMHLQSFRILEVKLFGTGLEIRVGAGCIESACT